ncbi:MAG: hypothetical protein ACYDH3_00105 [Candidatus Aminicenantales bacterium]
MSEVNGKVKLDLAIKCLSDHFWLYDGDARREIEAAIRILEAAGKVDVERSMRVLEMLVGIYVNRGIRVGRLEDDIANSGVEGIRALLEAIPANTTQEKADSPRVDTYWSDVGAELSSLLEAIPAKANAKAKEG